MDYNLFVRHSGGFERPDEAAAFQERSYEAFKAAFDAQYQGGRAPLQLGFHFTLMNDGAYWRALERFAGEVCVKADVVCTSYARLSEADAAIAKRAADCADGGRLELRLVDIAAAQAAGWSSGRSPACSRSR